MPPKKSIVTKGNNATSKHYGREEGIRYLTNLQPYTGLSVTLPSVNMIAPSHKEGIQLSNELSEETRKAIVLSALKFS